MRCFSLHAQDLQPRNADTRVYVFFREKLACSYERGISYD